MVEILGLVGLAVVVLCSVVRGRRILLLGQGVGAAVYAGHYALMGAHTAAAMMMLSVAQAVLAWPAHRPAWRMFGFAFTIPALAILTHLTWQGPTAALAAVALALSTLGRWGRTDLEVRVPLLASAVAWAAYDVAVGSLYALATHAFIAGALVWGWVAPRQARQVAGGAA